MTRATLVQVASSAASTPSGTGFIPTFKSASAAAGSAALFAVDKLLLIGGPAWLPVVTGSVVWRVEREPVYPRWWFWWFGSPTVESEIVAAPHPPERGVLPHINTGVGETQLEIDRRMISKKISQLKSRLAVIERDRREPG